MKKLFRFATFVLCFLFVFVSNVSCEKVFADVTKNYYTVFSDESKTTILFLKGDEIFEGDKYLSHDNKLYEIISVDSDEKTAVAKFIQDEEMPKFNVKKINDGEVEKTLSIQKELLVARALSSKKVGIYHTHNDESYYTPDGFDSVYGKGGIHDVGSALSKNFQKLGIETVYREDLHLPHNSGAYTRSQVTASAILDSGVDALFDIHRDSTKRSEYLTTVDGQTMSSIRLVVGSSSANYEENKKFAYSIKAYADEVYPNLIKDIFIGKGNYNQQLSTRAMLFEMGCENIEKDYAIKSTEYLAKVLDVVLFGSSGASELSLKNVSLVDDSGNKAVVVGLVNDSSAVASNSTLLYVLGVVGIVLVVLAIVLISSKKARYKVGRFFSEMFAGLFGKKASKH